MIHGECLIYELLNLTEEITNDSTVSLDVLEDAFYKLQDLINSKTNKKSCLVFKEVLEELEINYSDAFNISEKEISFALETDAVFELICTNLEEQQTYFDDTIVSNIHNLIIYDALNLPITFTEIKNLIDMSKNIFCLYESLRKYELENKNTTSILKLIAFFKYQMKNYLKEASQSTLTKIKMALAYYNSQILSYDELNIPNVNAPWHIVLLYDEGNLKKFSFIDRIEAYIELEEERRYQEEEQMENQEEQQFSFLNDISLESCEYDDVTYFFIYYLLLLDQYTKEIYNKKEKSYLLKKKYGLLNSADLTDLEDTLLENGALENYIFEINKDVLNTHSFDFLIPNFEEILKNSRQSDINIDIHHEIKPFIIINLLLLKGYLDLSINEEIKNELIEEIKNNQYYKNPNYTILTHLIDHIIFKEQGKKYKR